MDINSFALGYSAGKKKGGGAEPNIHYSLDTPPEDTSKLWVKTEKPSAVVVGQPEIFTDSTTEVFETLETMFPDAVRFASAVTVNEKVYLFCVRKTTYASSKDVYCFDPKTQELRKYENELDKDYCMAAFAPKGKKVYIFGCFTGSTSYDLAITFDTETLTTTTIPSIGHVYGSVAATYGNYIYIIGGTYFKKTGDTNEYNKIIRYNTSDGTYVVLDVGMPAEAENTIYGTVIGSKAYFCWQKSDLFCFDCESEKLTTVVGADSLPKFHEVGRIGDNLYVFSMFGTNTEMFRVNIDTGEIEGTGIIIPNRYQIGEKAYADSSTYVFGGRVNASTPIASIGRFYIGYDGFHVESESLCVIPSTENNIFKLINTDSVKMEIGVENILKGNQYNKGEEVEAALYNGDSWQTI